MDNKTFDISIKNIANRYNEEISKMVISGNPLTPYGMDMIWKKHCQVHVDGMYAIISDTVQQMILASSADMHDNIMSAVKRSAISEVECSYLSTTDGKVKIIVGLKIGSRYVQHDLGFMIDMTTGTVTSKHGDLLGACCLGTRKSDDSAC